MTLYTKCLNILAQENVIEMYKSNLEAIPLNEKKSILTLLCKRGLIKDTVLFSKLVSQRVTIMDLSECYVSDELLCCLHMCEFLRKLDLGLSRRQTRNITTECLKSLFPHLKFLRVLNLPNCKEFNDDVIEIIAQNCKLLQQLYIPNSSISDQSLHYVGQNFRYLYVLNISGNKVSDIGILHLVNGNTCQTLMELGIKDTLVTLKGISLITEKLSNLKIFDMGSLINSEEVNWSKSAFPSKAKQIFWTA